MSRSRRPGALTIAVQQKLVTNQSFLEGRCHESVPSTRVCEDREVDPEEEEVKDERNDDEANYSRQEMFGDAFL
jgi:hypothetical protein